MTKSEKLIKLVESSYKWIESSIDNMFSDDPQVFDEVLEYFGLKSKIDAEVAEFVKHLEISNRNDPNTRKPTEDESAEYSDEEYYRLVKELKFFYTPDNITDEINKLIKDGKLKIEREAEFEADFYAAKLNDIPVIIGYYDNNNEDPYIIVPEKDRDKI
jgi:hypothetical protein